MEKVKAKLVKFKRWFIASVTIIIVLLASFFAIPVLFPPTPATGAWLAGGYLYRKSFTVYNATGAGTNYQFPLTVINGTGTDSGSTVYINNKCRSDWADLRVCRTETVTVWIMNVTQYNGINVTMWFKTNDDMSSTNRTYYLYYGLSGASSGWSDATFDFWDTFNSLDWTKWTNSTGTGGGIYVESSNLKLNCTTAYTAKAMMFGTSNYSSGYAMQTSVKMDLDLLANNHRYVGLNPSDSAQYARWDWYSDTGVRTYTKNTTSSAYTSVSTPSANVYHTYDAYFRSATNFTFTKDGSQVATHSTYIPTAAIPACFGDDNGGGTPASASTVYVDYVFLRKYVFPEPYTGNWDAEQTNSPYPTEPPTQTPTNPANNVLVNISVYWHSQGGRTLSVAILEHDNSGALVNTSTVLSGTNAWANFSFTTATVGKHVVQWRQLCNDSTNSFNTTGWYYFTVNPLNAPLITNLIGLVDRINWTESISTVYLGTMFGTTNMTDLQNAIAASTDWQEVLTWSAFTMKFGIENETKIKWALDNATMVAGLPDSEGGSYIVYFRGLLYGFYWADKYSYLQDKWNTTTAFNNFASAYNWTGHGFLWYVNTTYTESISYGPRYYDECAETLACFLTFYEVCNVSEALTYAETEWKYVNNYLWVTDPTYGAPHFAYYNVDNVTGYGWECEAGSFLQVIGWLKYLSPSVGNISRFITDISNRFLADKWASPQWTGNTTGGYTLTPALIVHHHYTNAQRRLTNTITAWSSLYALYLLFNDTEVQNFKDMLNGYGAYERGWQCLYSERADGSLYYATNGEFYYLSNDPTTHDNTTMALATCLQLFMGMTPVNATLAVPVEELRYEYLYNMFDSQLFNISFTTRKLTVGISKVGAINFTYNSTATQMLNETGLYELTFDSNWNTITNCTKIGELPSRNYLALGTSLNVGDNNCTAWEEDVGRTLGEVNASLLLNGISWARIMVDYGNGTQWSLVYGQIYNSEKLVTATTNTLWIYCDVAGEWWHTYP